MFLDELAEFHVGVLEALRQPIEEGRIRVSRLSGPRVMPARFQLVAATNPCPCGYRKMVGDCNCAEAAIARYLRRLSGPLLDRFDLRIQVQPPDPHLLLTPGREETTEKVAARVAGVRRLSLERGLASNAQTPPDRVDEIAPLTATGRSRLLEALKKGELTGRGVHRVRLVARTMADLREESHTLNGEQIDLAIAMRGLPSDMAERASA